MPDSDEPKEKAESPVEEVTSEVAKEAAVRLSAREIFDVVVDSARDELRRPLAGLAFSALAGGITIGLSALAVALVHSFWGAATDSGAVPLLAAAVYPIGFIAVIIGRAQFFTENTLYPVVLALAESGHLRRMFAFWGTVLGANLIGAWIFAVLLMRSGAVGANIHAALGDLGVSAAAGSFGAIFWSGVIGGWIMALVAWMVSASSWTTGQIVVTWLLTFIIALGGFAHCVATSAEILSAVVVGRVSWLHYGHWIAAAVLGNIAGGVVIVSLLNYGQVKAGVE